MAAPEPNPASATNLDLDTFASIAGLQTLGEADAIDHEDEDETVTPEDALASAIKQLQALTAENAELRRDLAEQRTTHISLREANRELEWRCRAGGEGGDPEGAAEMAEEWRDMEQKVQLLLTENGILESAQREMQVALQREQANAIELQASHAEALGGAQRAREAQLVAEEETRRAQAEASALRDHAHEQQSVAATEAVAVQKLRQELTAVRAEAEAAHLKTREAYARLEAQQSCHAQAEAEAQGREARLKDAHGRQRIELEAGARRAEALAAQLTQAQS